MCKSLLRLKRTSRGRPSSRPPDTEGPRRRGRDAEQNRALFELQWQEGNESVGNVLRSGTREAATPNSIESEVGHALLLVEMADTLFFQRPKEFPLG